MRDAAHYPASKSGGAQHKAVPNRDVRDRNASDRSSYFLVGWQALSNWACVHIFEYSAFQPSAHCCFVGLLAARAALLNARAPASKIAKRIFLLL